MQKQEFIVNLGDASFAIRISDLRQGQFNWKTQRHCNADYELHMILSGSCTISVEEQQYSLSAGDAILISPGRYHQPLSTDSVFWRISVSFFPLSGNAAELIEKNGTICIISLTEAMLQLAFRILEECNNDLPFQKDLTGAMLSQLMVYMLRKLSIPEHFAEPELSSDWRTDVIDNFFSENLTYGTQMQLAEQLHLSRRQLSRVMQIHYGMNFRQKLLSARMDRAGWLLKTTNLPISQVYSHVGYNSEAVFYQNFKAYYGMTPRLYREKYKKQKQ